MNVKPHVRPKKRVPIEIYIDGSCSGNPGPGGWAAVCCIGGKKKKSCGFSPKITTNNRAELNGAIQGLSALRAPCDVTFYTDSNYLVTGGTHSFKWLTDPKRKNSDLWTMFFIMLNKGGHTYKFIKIAGHTGVEMNELADRLAKAECAKARHALLETRYV